MFEYINFILKKIVPINEKLSTIAFLQDKTWNRLNPNEVEEKWFFRSNGILSISQNGDIIDGKYEYLNEYLSIHILNEKQLFEKHFIYNEMLILKKDSVESEFLAFFDNTKFTKSDFVAHLEHSRKKDLNIEQITLIDSSTVEIIRETSDKEIKIGNTVLINGKKMSENLIETDYNIYELINGKISKIYFKKKYKYLNQDLHVKQKTHKILIGDEIIFSSQKLKNNLLKIQPLIGVKQTNNIIENIFHIEYIETFIKNKKIEIWKKQKSKFSFGDIVLTNNEKVSDGKYWIDFLTIINVHNGKIV